MKLKVKFISRYILAILFALSLLCLGGSKPLENIESEIYLAIFLFSLEFIDKNINSFTSIGIEIKRIFTLVNQVHKDKLLRLDIKKSNQKLWFVV